MKKAVYKNYGIFESEDGSIQCLKILENTKAALREVAVMRGIEYDETWNTQFFGKKVIEAITGKTVKTNECITVRAGNFSIHKNESGSISVAKLYDNTEEGLREIADEIDFKYESTWNTRQFGANLIKYLNETPPLMLAMKAAFKK